MRINNPCIEDYLSDDNLLLLEAYAREGMTMTNIADCIGISKATLDKWAEDSELIKKALSQTKELTKFKVQNALVKAACGYCHTETKTVFEYHPLSKEENKMKQIRKEVITKNEKPNVSAIQFYLNNVDNENWKRNRDNVHTFDEEDAEITVNIIRKGKDTDIPIGEQKEETWEYDDSGNVQSQTSRMSKILNEDTKLEDEWDNYVIEEDVEPQNTKTQVNPELEEYGW